MAKKRKTIESGLIRGLEEALAHSKGTLKLKETVRELPSPAPKWKPRYSKTSQRDL